MDLREQKFGIEIEMTGISRKKAADVIAEYFGTEADYIGGQYKIYRATDRTNRNWDLTYDSSINCTQRVNGRKVSTNGDFACELVSPILQYDDIATLQEIVRLLREKGAYPNSSCGIHIHINAAPYNAQQLRNLVNIVAAKEDIIFKALQVDGDRERRYCKKVNKDFLETLNQKKPKTMHELKYIWYKGRDGSHIHYHDSRYHCLNLHSVFQKGTIEFRAFNSYESSEKQSLHAGKIKSYIQLCLGMTAQAHNQKGASPIPTQSSNEKYTFRTWLLRMGMIGDEFKTARNLLLGHLDGNIAWKDPLQAEAQKARLREKRELEKVNQEKQEPVIEPELEQDNEQELEEEQGMTMTIDM